MISFGNFVCHILFTYHYKGNLIIFFSFLMYFFIFSQPAIFKPFIFKNNKMPHEGTKVAKMHSYWVLIHAFQYINDYLYVLNTFCSLSQNSKIAEKRTGANELKNAISDFNEICPNVFFFLFCFVLFCFNKCFTFELRCKIP